MIFYDPGYQPTPTLPVLQLLKPKQSDPSFPLDQKIVNFLRGQPEAVSTWTIANAVAVTLNPANRSQRRELTVQIPGGIAQHVHFGCIRRVGRNYLTLR
jgi:hypothetical protein